MAKKNTTIQLQTLILLATREDLIMFLLGYAENNASFKRDLLSFLVSKYLDNEETLKDYIGMMKDAFCQTKDVGNRWHSFEITDWDSVFDSAMKVIGEGRKLLDLGNADAAATIAVEFFHMFSREFDEASFFDDVDYEDGGVYECEQAAELLFDAIDHNNITPKVQEKLLEELKAISQTSFPHDLNNYGIFDYDEMLMKVNKKVMTDEDALSLLNSQLKQHSGQYDEPAYVTRKIELLRQMNRVEEADITEKQYLHLPQIRDKAIRHCIESSQYNKAIRYAEEGVAMASTTNEHIHPAHWRKLLLEVYEMTNNTEKQIDVARALFISEGGQKEYYSKLKKLIEPRKWKEYLSDLLADAKLSSKPNWGRCNLADIYVEEGESERLFAIIMENSSYDTDVLNRYAKHAGDVHAEELLGRYKEILVNDAKRNVNAKAYQRIAQAMDKMCELKGGKSAAHELAELFRLQYKRRSSMMAEIRRF